MSASAPPDQRPRLFRSGLDSLYVSYYLNVAQSALDFEEINYQRERMRQSRSNDFEELTLGSEAFALRPFGRHPYQYVLSNTAFTVHLAERMQPSCYVQFSSEALSCFSLSAVL
jgi:hypothetical protein